jgi:hypothetical protein
MIHEEYRPFRVAQVVVPTLPSQVIRYSLTPPSQAIELWVHACTHIYAEATYAIGAGEDNPVVDRSSPDGFFWVYPTTQKETVIVGALVKAGVLSPGIEVGKS